jgi:1-phosphofructokinase family hexose kinase
MELNQIFTVTVNPSIDREWIVDSLDFDRILHSLESHIDVGGKGINVSRMLNTLGVKTTALGFVGGQNGEFLQNGLQSQVIDIDFIWIKGNSRTNISVTNHQNNHYIKINEPGPEISAGEQNQLIEKIKMLAHKGDCWVLSGSLPPCVPPDYYAKLIEIIQAKGAIAILDTSGEALAHGCNTAPFMIKPNTSELQELTKMPVDDTNKILNAVDQLHKKGIQIIIISMGS